MSEEKLDDTKTLHNVPLKAKKGDSLMKHAMRRLFANKAAVAAMIVLLVLILLAFFGPHLRPYAIDEVFWDDFQTAPSLENGHWFGTDANGRDLFVRVLYGMRISLLVGLCATAVSLIIGVAYGAIAGYAGGRTDSIMMRVVDVLYSMPFMFFVILLMVFFGRNIYLMFAAIGAVEWLTMARIVRGQAMSLKHKEFVQAAEVLGVSPLSIIRRHIVPNTLGTVVVYVTLTIPLAILTESFLSFLGLGVQEPMTSLGVLISEGAKQMESAPWLLIFPALFLAIMLFCFNFIGDGLRDAFDPKER
ncbi:ABC transporter permease [Suttonella ornithocola]|uniref:Oligopeptide transport system permease protein OppC n=1 Tax=Suttonella ornithocola TaxID=279832 RepID=A0A380MV80_9GAMM|nr:ABC transporter permease subunit [Suttonella ornithocola]SUO96465.1 Oligopeptide transport system permease protein oppC [Suttonella ornithocola]